MATLVASPLPPAQDSDVTLNSNTQHDEGGKDQFFSDTVEKILMDVESRQAAHDLSSSDVFDSSPSAKKSHAGGSDGTDNATEIQGIISSGPLNLQEIEQLVLLCASANTSFQAELSTSPEGSVGASSGFGLVDSDSLVSLIPLLEKHVVHAASINLIKEVQDAVMKQEDSSNVESWLKTKTGAEKISCLKQGLHAATVMLTIMMSPGVDQRVVSEDGIEGCISLMRYHLMKNVIPAISGTGHILVEGSSSSSNTNTSSPPPKKRRRTNSSGMNKDERLLLGEMKKLYKPILKSVGFLSALMERLEAFLLSVRLDERPLLMLCSSGLETFAIDPATSANGENVSITHLLQESSIGLITTVFQKYPKQRIVIIEDLFPLMLKLPTSKRSMRIYPVRVAFTHQDRLNRRRVSDVSSGNRSPASRAVQTDQQLIQSVTALIVSLVTSCVMLPVSLSPQGSSNTEDDNNTPQQKHSSGLQDCQDICNLFVNYLVQRCSCKGGDGGASEFRPILNNLIDDLMALQLLPEYPSAEMILLSICDNLKNRLLRASSVAGSKPSGPVIEATFLTTAFDALGKICAAFAGHLSVHMERPLCLSTSRDIKDVDDRSSADETKDIETKKELRCFCDRPNLTDTFLMDCDRCHSWFHGSCYGYSKETMPKVWFCDECKLQLMVLEQTKTFASKKLKERRMNEMNGNTENAETNEGLATLELDETHVFRQLLLNYLSTMSPTTTSLSARQFHIANFLEQLESLKRKSDAGRGVYDLELLCQHFLGQWEKTGGLSIQSNGTMMWSTTSGGQNGTQSTYECLSTEGNERLMLAFAVTKSGMSREFPYLLGAIEQLMGDSSFVNLRKLSVKAISQIIEADPSIMLLPKIRNAVSARFQDDAISCREAAVALVGSYVRQTPIVATAFHSPLISRLTDTGVSVRKRTIKIFRDVLTTNPSYKGSAGACAAMLQRAADPKEDDGVRDLIHALFEELWLASGKDTVPLKTKHNLLPATTVDSSLKNISTNTVGIVTPNKTNGKQSDKGASESILKSPFGVTVEQMVEVVMSSGGSDSLAKLMKELLFGFSDSNKNKKAAERRKRQDTAQRHCSHLVGALLEQLLSFEEKRPKPQGGKKIVAIMRTFYVFAEVSPEAVLDNVEPLLPYLSGRNEVVQQFEPEIVSSVANVISRLTQIMTADDILRLSDGSTGKDLVNITKRFNNDAIAPAVKALVMLARHENADQAGTFQKHLMSLAATFYGYLDKQKDITEDFSSSDKNVRDSVHRSLSVMGNVCCYHDIEDESTDWSNEYDDCIEVKKSELSWQNIPLACYGLFLKYLKKKNVSTKSAALRAMNGIFTSQPRVLLAVEQKGLVAEVMSDESHAGLQLDALRCWRDILLAEDKRVESGEAKAKLDSKKEMSVSRKVGGDQDGDATLVGGVLTEHAPRLYELTESPHEPIRRAAVDLLGTLLTQGLINPLQTVPFLFALQGDVHCPTIRSAALKLIIKESDRRPDMLKQRICAGVKQTFNFQNKVYGTANAVVERKGEVECIFSSIFKESIRKNKKHRESLYRSLLALFEEPSSLEEGKRRKKKSKGGGYLEKLPLLSFTAQVLAHLPYNAANDPLLIIHHISSISALNGERLVDAFASFLRPYGLASADEHDDHIADEDAIERAAKMKNPSRSKEIKTLNQANFDLLRFAELCAEASSIALLLRLKGHLQHAYNLSELRCLEFSPDAKEKIADRGISISEKVKLFDANVAGGDPHLDNLIKQYAEFRKLVRSSSMMDVESEGEEEESRHGKKRKAHPSSSDEGDSENEAVQA